MGKLEDQVEELASQMKALQTQLKQKSEEAIRERKLSSKSIETFS